MQIKRIAFCLTEYTTEKNYGGLAIFTKKLVNILKKHNIKCTLFVCSDIESTLSNNHVTIYKIKTINFFSKILRYLNKNFFYLYQSYVFNRALKRFLFKNRIDFIHFTNYQSLPFFFNLNIPSTCRLSSLESLWDNNKSKFGFYLEKKSLQKFKSIISPSQYLIRELKNSYKLNATYFPQIIEKIKTKNRKFKYKFILTFGTISKNKGIDFIKKNVEEIINYKNDIHYLWIGDLDKKFETSHSSFENKLRKIANYNKIKILKKVNQYKLFQYIKASEFIILPSIVENSSNSCLEAMQFGKIVLATKNSGFNDLIKNNTNGFLFNKYSNYDFSKKMKLIRNLSNFKKKIISNNAKRTSFAYSEGKVYKKYIKLINSIKQKN
jgi:glycosyltransferase involved in cell wall biosynthesis